VAAKPDVLKRSAQFALCPCYGRNVDELGWLIVMLLLPVRAAARAFGLALDYMLLTYTRRLAYGCWFAASVRWAIWRRGPSYVRGHAVYDLSPGWLPPSLVMLALLYLLWATLQPVLATLARRGRLPKLFDAKLLPPQASALWTCMVWSERTLGMLLLTAAFYG
jgi:hypothetical protein